MKKTNSKRFDRSWLVVVCILAIAVFLRVFVFEIVTIVGDSMSPTLLNGHKIVIWKMGYTPTRGDIIVLESSDGDLVKRVIALPGETVEIVDGTIYINQKQLDQVYQYPSQSHNSMATITIPQNCIFVMGDNRDHSSDSRTLGPIPLYSVKGKMLFEMW